MREKSLAAIATDRGLVGGPFGSSLVGEDYVDSGIPVIRGVNMVKRHVGGEFVFITAQKYVKDLARNSAASGDLIFTQRGTLGQVAIVPDGPYDKYVVSQSQMRLRVDKKLADPRFVYYACHQSSFRRQISDNAIATGVPHINLGILSRLTIPWFALREQQAIADVLEALDDKIAGNDRIRTLTDELCRARFQCLAAERGRTKLCTMAIVNAALTKAGAGPTLRYIDISSVGQGTYEFPEESFWTNAPGRARRIVRRGDTIWSTVRPNRRSHALILDEDPSLIASTGLAVLTALGGQVAGLYEATRTEEFAEFLESVADGSAYPAVRADRFDQAPIPALRHEEWEAFESFAFPLRQRAHAAEVESRRLVAARDELLPLLMSGKVHVRDAEQTPREVL